MCFQKTNRTCQFASCGVALALLFLSSGCGGEAVGEIRGSVKGKVTLDGQPVKQGSIRFFPTGGTTGPDAGGHITNGEYKIDLDKGVAIGKNRVEIRANKPTGKKVKALMNDTMVDEMEEAIPEQFNTKSKLVKSVDKGENEIDFPLTSK